IAPYGPRPRSLEITLNYIPTLLNFIFVLNNFLGACRTRSDRLYGKDITGIFEIEVKKCQI
ncbi:MAG: hypothetical protein JW882_21225, partial [Deltaproteobacteria bacterium]|nr:hypothetical protein [Deltaproteobacteria bacterium]